MRQRSRFMLLGLLAFAIAMLAVFPAAWLRSALPPQVTCTQLAGSIWRGQCEAPALAMPGKPTFKLDTLSWRLQPLPLLRGRLQADVSLRGKALTADANITLQSGGRTRIANLSGSGALDRTVLAALPAGWSANAEAQDLTLEISTGKLSALSGVVLARQLRDARGTGFGDYRLEFTPQSAPPYRGALTDQGGPMQLQAELLLNSDQSWQLRGTVILRPGSPAGLASALDHLATADINGRRNFTIEGVAR